MGFQKKEFPDVIDSVTLWNSKQTEFSSFLWCEDWREQGTSMGPN